MPKIPLTEFEDPRITWISINKFLYRELRKILFPRRISFPEFVNYLIYLAVNKDPRLNAVCSEIIANRKAADYVDMIGGLDEEGMLHAIKKLREDQKKGVILPTGLGTSTQEEGDNEGVERIEVEEE